MADVICSLDVRGLDTLKREAPQRADRICGKIAFDWDADMDSHFSNTSPSPVGSPPGIDTGNLKNSTVPRRIRPMLWGIYGAHYGSDYLERGTAKMGARPFIVPSGERIAKQITEAFKDFAKL